MSGREANEVGVVCQVGGPKRKRTISTFASSTTSIPIIRSLASARVVDSIGQGLTTAGLDAGVEADAVGSAVGDVGAGRLVAGAGLGLASSDAIGQAEAAGLQAPSEAAGDMDADTAGVAPVVQPATVSDTSSTSATRTGSVRRRAMAG